MITIIIVFSYLILFNYFNKLYIGDSGSYLIGFLLGYLSRSNNMITTALGTTDFIVIGNIIPGLIANWMDRQGVVRTVSVVLLTAVIVKLLVIILFGGTIFE